MLNLSIIPNDYCAFKPYIIPGLMRLASEKGYEYIDFRLSDSTWKRLDKGDDGVYTDIILRYETALRTGMDFIEL